MGGVEALALLQVIINQFKGTMKESDNCTVVKSVAHGADIYMVFSNKVFLYTISSGDLDAVTITYELPTDRDIDDHTLTTKDAVEVVQFLLQRIQSSHMATYDDNDVSDHTFLTEVPDSLVTAIGHLRHLAKLSEINILNRYITSHINRHIKYSELLIIARQKDDY